MLDNPGTGDMPTPPASDAPANDSAPVKKSTPKKEEEISVEDLPF